MESLGLCYPTHYKLLCSEMQQSKKILNFYIFKSNAHEFFFPINTSGVYSRW